MMDFVHKTFDWFKNNKLTGFLVIVVAYLLLTNLPIRPLSLMKTSNNYGTDMMYDSYESAAPMMGIGAGGGTSLNSRSMMYNPVAPRPDITDRKVITDSYLSLLVKDVRDTIEIIMSSARELGGYVVERDISTPEFGEDGSIAIRIPSDKLDEALTRFRELAIKVVSENISGYDITDEFVDVEERISKLETTKARFEEIMEEATEVEEILMVQREIFNLQDQIDAYKGRLTYMDAASSTTLIRVYLSTDELGLPYTPSDAWRPAAVFKQAVRAMLEDLVGIGNAAIWLAVYLPLILIGIIVLKIVIQLLRKKKNQ